MAKAKKETKTKKKEPKHLDRDEFELEEIAYALTEAKEEQKYKVFSVYKKDEPLTGMVTNMDANTKLIHIKDKYMDIHKVHFLDILNVSECDY
ncbi:YolD-like family protein [Lysinibacillus parviboronicapiens]|uniref:YolD-like family protein n=1 Tax=Lysinibacillus parviboronicapiens TaxID=436516 RepID=UPI00187D6201|nr:YolD-like family protein [Lysinibacillus parviboronicapiens]